MPDEKSTDGITPPTFTYSRWRHGGWYVHGVRYPSGASGCVTNNFADRKWRIACDTRPFEEQPTFKSRAEAALGEWEMVRNLPEHGDLHKTMSEILSEFPTEAVRRVPAGHIPRNHVAFFRSRDGYPFRIASDSRERVRVIDYEVPEGHAIPDHAAC